MSFQLSDFEEAGIRFLKLKNIKYRSQLVIIPALGAALLDLQFNLSGSLYSILDHPPIDAQFLPTYLVKFPGGKFISFS